MKKRFWALLLAVMMVVSVLPTSAFAVDAESPVEGEVTATKSLVCDGAGNPIVDADGCYTIKLTVQGNPVTTSVQPNADVVLVVDNSGSMASRVGQECTATQFRKTESYNFLILWTWHSYVCDQCGATYFSIVGNATGNIYYTDLPDKCTGEVGTVVRMNAAKDVSKEFAQSILQNSDGSPTGNRLAVIGFAHENDQGGANDTGAIKVQKDLTDNLSAVTGEINKMAAKGGTNYSAALQKAYDYLNGRSATEKANHPGYVIFISDGAPGRSGESLKDSDWNGENQIAALKAAGITVYTVGIALEEGPAEYLKNMASDEKTDHFINVKGENYKADLSDILAEWAAQIKKVPAGTNAVMTDVVDTDKFDIVADGYAGLTLGEDKKTLTWKIGNIPETVQEKTIKIKPKTGVYGNDIPTNKDVNLTYLPAGETTKYEKILKEQIGDPTVTIAPPATTVTVTFDANGGAWENAVDGYTMTGAESPYTAAAVEVEKGSPLTLIGTAPTRTDYTFTKWYQDKDCQIEVPTFISVLVNSDITLYAGWAPATPNTVNYTVRQHYINAQGEDALTVNVINASAAAGTKIVNLISSMEQDYNDDSNDIHYIYVQANTKLNSVALIRETAVLSANDVIDLYYYQDIWSDTENSTNEGDNIPDMYQAVVKFMPGDLRGTVTGDGTTQVFTLENNDTGANTTSGTVTPDMTNVTVKANGGFAFDIWTKDKDETAVQPVQAWTVSGGNTITFYAHFDTDVIGGVNGGDGIPDKYQVTVKYEAINGSIISTPISEVLTIRNAAGQLVTSGTVTISGAEAESEKGDFNGWTSNNAVDLSSEDDTLSSLEINAVGGATYTFTASFGEVVSAENIHKAVVPNMIEVENIAIPEGITYPGTDNAGNVLPVIAKAGDQVTLLYAITVTGGQGDVFAVTEEVGTTFIGSTGCKLAATMSIPAQYVGTLDNTTPTTNNVTATLYFTKTFTITADTEKLTNSIVLHDDTTKEEEVPVLVPGIAVEKTVNKTSVTVGDTVKYTITVKNTGNVDLTNVNVVEAFGGDFSKITNVTGADLVTKNGFVIRELKAGSDPVEITFSYKTTKRETLTNSVVVEGTYEPGKTVRDEDSSAPVTVKSEPITPVGPSKPQLNYEDHYAYVVGYPDGLVHPERNITRAEVATIFFRMLLDESREYFWAQENDFSDVAETDWFNNAVSTLANAQLINGYPDGSYRPNANITRAEFATIAIRFFLDEDVEIEENNLSDVKGHWAEANINLAYALELINGYPDGTFRPDQKITRAEAMAIVNRVLKRAPEKDHLLKDMIEWPDNLNTAAWYYADVQEATNSHKFHMDKEEEYEIWTELLPVRDWVALEQEWSKANSSKNPGEVVDIKITTPEAGDNGLKLD